MAILIIFGIAAVGIILALLCSTPNNESDKQTTPTHQKWYCPKCDNVITSIKVVVDSKGRSMNLCKICNSKVIDYKENMPECPTCHSKDIIKLTDLNKATHAVAFGVLSKTARSQFKCNNCGYKW